MPTTPIGWAFFWACGPYAFWRWAYDIEQRARHTPVSDYVPEL
jgi:hypothetical protein